MRLLESPARPAVIEAGEPAARLYCLGAWAGLTVVAMAFVAGFGPSFPRWDDFAILRVYLGDQPISLGWLWSQHNEHRILLPRLVLLGLLKLGGGDFRAGMVFNVIALSAISCGWMLTARSFRRGWSIADVVFPLGLLHLGHHANLLWAWQVQFLLSTVLAGGVLILIVRDPTLSRLSSKPILAALLIGLPLCGANGLAFVPALASWLLVESVRTASGDGRARVFKAAIAALSLGLVAFYFVDYRSSGHQATTATIGSRLVTTIQFLSLTFGLAAAECWPYSGALVVGLIGVSLVLLVRVVFIRPDERSRALGLLGFLGGGLALALGLGWGRAGSGAAAGFEARYVTLAAPLIGVLAFVWNLYGGATLSRLVPMGLATILLVLLWPNDRDGLAAGRDLAVQAARLEGEIRAGSPTYLVIKQSSGLLHPSEDELAAILPRLRERGLGIFRLLRPDPPFREVAIPVVPADVRGAVWEGGTARVTGVDPRISFAIPGDPLVAGVRLSYSHASDDGKPARFQFDWRRSGQSSDPSRRRFSNWNLPTGPDRSTTIWIGERVGEITIQPDNRPCEFRLGSIVLLIPPG